MKTKILVTHTPNPNVIFNRRSPLPSQPTKMMNMDIKTMTIWLHGH